MVKQYIRLFPQEYKDFRFGVKEKQRDLNTKFAEVKGPEEIVERLLYEVPETLWNLINMKTTADEHKWLSSKEGAHWFAREFEHFRISSEV